MTANSKRERSRKNNKLKENITGILPSPDGDGVVVNIFFSRSTYAAFQKFVLRGFVCILIIAHMELYMKYSVSYYIMV